MYSVTEPEAILAMAPHPVWLDFSPPPTKKINVRYCLGNILHCPPAECLDAPLHVSLFASILHLQRILLILFLSTTKNQLLCSFCANCRLWAGIDSLSL